MKDEAMKCNEIRETMPDLASGLTTATPEVNAHIQSCSGCAEELAELRQTMALLDEWVTPEPSPYFDTRLRARMREEAATQSTGISWLRVPWLRRPALAFSLAAMLIMGITLFRGDGLRHNRSDQMAALPGTAVSDLQALDKNHELYSDFDILDDLEVQQNVAANP
jgi:anti-sigma factor RsiW